ncbi:MAG: GDP-mannose 4,6-dehydratase [Candidatus Diapherotrites archaeon]|nr:GDP-mannose 4,6-dehydratase [Candidatus Micrarchaeota archaeon]
MGDENFWQGKKAFVTGADGFIGSWVAKGLLEKGANVYCLARDVKKDAGYDVLGIRDKITLVHGDLIDYASLERPVREYEIDSVFHLAAQALVGVANSGPMSTFESNIRGTYNLLEACRRAERVKRIVVASSDKAYGVQEKLPYTEDSPLHGAYPYDASKACTDIIARSYFTTYGMPVTVTRNANTYGGGDMNFSRIVPDAIRCALEGKALEIRSDGKAERDYMYAQDAVSAYLTLAENAEQEGVKGEAFNFGTGKPVSVLEVVKEINGIVDSAVEPKVLGSAKNEIDRQWLDSGKAARVLGWKPEYSLAQGLKETVEWYRHYLKK